MNTNSVKTAQINDAKTINGTEQDMSVEMESSEIAGSSVGGHDPRADKKPTSNLVRSFGKWAKGKQSVCVRVLTTKHPELCASRPGGCNGLCAYLKDQWAGSTKWRTGNKKNLTKKAMEGYIDIGNGDEFILPYDMVIDALAYESDIADGKRESAERPDWFGEEQELALIKILDNETINDGDATEAEVSYTDVMGKLGQLINISRRKNNDVSTIASSPNYTYSYVKDVFPGYVIYGAEYTNSAGLRECDLYKQQYEVASGNVNLVGDPSKVVQTYVAAEADVDEPLSIPATEADISLEKKMSIAREVLQKLHGTKTSYTDGPSVGIEDKYVSVKEVFDTYAIYSIGWEGDLMKQSFTWDEDDFIPSGDPVKVEIKYVESKSEESAKDTTKELDMNIQKDPYVMISTESGTLVVETDDSGMILRGPKSLIGKVVPVSETYVETSVSDVFEANESLITENGILKGAGVSEVEVSEMIIQEADVLEATTEKELITPGGVNVDAIIRVIVPGPGNSKDKFYYPATAVESTLNVFDGKKMYKNHTTRKQDMEREGQPRNVDDWVATVEETWADNGIGYAGISFVDESFQAKAKKGMRHLGVSVRGRVKARPGKVNGKHYNVVEGFTYGGSVDFVTEAGAGGGFVSIAESDIMEGNVEIKEMTLDQLMEANPEAFVAHAERIQAESKESSTTEDSTTVTDTEKVAEGATLEQIAELIDSKFAAFGEQIKTEVKESLTTRDVQDNRMILDTKLKASGLPAATQKRLRRELHDVTFDGVDATESEVAKTPLEMFAAHADVMIIEADAEIKEATTDRTIVDDGGAGELVVTEAGRIFEAKPKGVLDKINTRLGIVVGGSAKPAPAGDEESAKTS